MCVRHLVKIINGFESIQRFLYQKINRLFRYYSSNFTIITHSLMFFYYISESRDISNKISSLRNVSIKASGLANAASDKIKDLVRQLDNLKKHCIVKDMPLCDTVNTYALELRMRFDMVYIFIYKPVDR